MIDEAVRQAMHSVVEDRREKIASLTAHALSAEQAHEERFQRLLAILGQLTDSELVILRAHVFSREGRRTAEENEHLLYTEGVSLGASEEVLNVETLRASFVEHLKTLGLLDTPLATARGPEGRSTQIPEVDSFTQQLRTSGRCVTALGTLLLKVIDFYPEDRQE